MSGIGDPMLHTKSRLAALAGCAASVLILAGCGAREPVEVPPAAPASIAPDYEASQAPESMGAPSAEAAPADGLLGGPSDAPPAAVDPASSREGLKTWRRADGTLVTAMAPIADPEPQPESQPRSQPASEPQGAMLYAPDAVAAPAPRRSARPTPRPTAAPPAVKAVAKPAPVRSPVARSAPTPAVVAPLPAPVKPLVAAKPDAPLVRAPTSPAPTKAAPAKPLTKLQQLQAALAPEATRGAVLAAGVSLGQGQEGQVTLSLPATLGDRIRSEAAKLGLGKAASKTSAYADLRGDGYEVTPNGRQTAVVGPGQQATFAWQVKPTPAAKGQLKTEFGVELDGTRPAQGFTLGSITRQVAPIPAGIKAKAEGVKLAMPDLGRFETIDVPGLGKMPGKSVLGGALMLLALLILVLIARNASAAGGRTDRRRQRPPPMDLGRDGPASEAPRTASAPSANPTAAAAGGALAGAAATSAVRRDDQPPAQEEYAPFDTPLSESHGPGEARDAPRQVQSPELEPTR
jgi:predicted small lipoprotein YifL